MTREGQAEKLTALCGETDARAGGEWSADCEDCEAALRLVLNFPV